jgi:hypothetical protein
VELFFNAMPSRSTGQSPFSVVFGKEPLLPIDLAVESSVPKVNEELSLL